MGPKLYPGHFFWKRSVPVIVMLCMLLLVSGQSIITLPRHQISPLTPYGTEIFTRITNTAGVPDTLYPLYNPNHPGHEDIFSDSSHLLNYLMSQVNFNTDTESIKLQLMQVVGRFVKNPRKANNLNIFQEAQSNVHDSAMVRKFSLIGSELGIPNWQCGSFVRHACHILLATGYFTPSDFRIVNLPFHSVMEFNYYGRWTLADVSVNTSAFMVPNPQSPNGFASADDVIHNSSLLDDSVRFVPTDVDGNDLPYSGQYLSMNDYKKYYYNPTYNSFSDTAPLYNLSSAIVLCPGCSLEYRFKTGYVIDSSILQVKNTLSDNFRLIGYYGIKYKVTGNSIYLDSTFYYMYNGPASIIGIPYSSAKSAFDANLIQYYSPNPDWSPSYYDITPQLHFHVPASTDTLYSTKDILLPFLTTNIRLQNQDTIVQSDLPLWADSLSGQPPIVPYRGIVYWGYIKSILPPNTILDLDLAWNPAIINFYQGGPMFRSMHGSEIVETSTDAVSGIAENKIEGAFNIYPNPAKEAMYLSCPETSIGYRLEVYDMLGRKISSQTITGTKNLINISAAMPGTYIYRLVNRMDEVTGNGLFVKM
ncbi:MAG TPA: T9SS type A sorting domain-containing protein [Chitinophagales bacterium]|nr:T9SS type A sorting domain-containing protein [Chitinophagales bacterium]